MMDLKNSPQDSNSFENLENLQNDKIIGLESSLKSLQNEIVAQKKVVKNALRFSIIVGLVSIFFIALNFSILLIIATGIAGGERKLNILQERIDGLKKESQSLENTQK